MSFLWRLATGSSSNNNTTNINNVCQDEPDDAAIVVVNNSNNFLCQHEPDDAAVVFNHKKNKTVQQSTTKTTTTTATESSSHIEQKEETPLNESNGSGSNRAVVAVAAATNIPKEENILVYNSNINTTRQTSTAITTTTASSTTIHWKEAHYETCLRKGSLAVSIHQVLKLYHSVSYVPQQLQQSTSTSSSTSQDEVFLWKEKEEQSEQKKGSDKENETLQQSLQKLLMEEQYQSTDDESSSSSNNKSLLARFSRLLYTAITGTSSSLSSNDDDLANMHASQAAAAAEVDDAVLYQESLRNASGTSTRIIKDSDLIVNTDLTRRVLKLLAKIITQQQQQQQHSTDPLVVPMPSFADWFLHSINSNRNNHATTSLSQDEEEPALLDLITRLPQHQVQVLLQTLASNTTNKQQQQQQSSLRVVLDRNPPLFVLGVTTDRTCQVATALYDLEHAQDNLERNIHQAHETAAQYAAKALQYKRNATTITTRTATTTSNNTSQQAALHCLQLRKLYLNRAAHDENVLLNLKQTQLTLETASQQQSIVNVLASARDALKMLRTSTAGAGDTEQILEDYALEMEWSQQMQQSLLEATAAVGNDIVDVDDDELLQQLEELTLEEEEEQQQQQQKQEVLPLPAAEGTGGNSSSRSPTDDLVLPVTEEAKEPRLDSLASVAQESSATQQPPVALT